MLPLPPPPQPKPRQQGKDVRALYTAFTEALGYTNPSKIERGRINAAIRDLPNDATPEQVTRRTAIFLKESGLTFVGPQGIVGNWSRLAELDKPRHTNPRPIYSPPPADDADWNTPPPDVKQHIDTILGRRPVTPDQPEDPNEDPSA